jgi:energy-coupling factor transporter ATP-binding protein EcfA2
MDHDAPAGLSHPPDRAPAHPLVERVERLAAVADRRWAMAERPGPARERARELREHVHSYLLPRVRSLESPLVVLLLGPTGSGKSTLINTLAGAPVSRTGVLRPTTRDAVLLATEADAVQLSRGPLASIPADRIERAVAPASSAGVAVIDAPDIDSVEHDNRALADSLVELADLCVFVTTATRYADRVPWDVLRRVQARGLPVIVLVNRLPRPEDDVRTVLEDVRRLVSGAGLATPTSGAGLEILGVAEGDLAGDGWRFGTNAVRPLQRRISQLQGDRDARRALAERALAGALAGIGPLAHSVADDLEHEAIDADALRRTAETIHAEETRALVEELQRGRFLREEVLRQWHTFVGADQVTRLFTSGIEKLRGTVSAVIRGTPPAPVAAVEKGATRDLTALVAAHAGDAARRTAARWSEQALVADKVAADGGLWSASPDLAERLEGRLAEWVAAIATDVAETGAPKRSLARGASLGINAAGTTVMLATFSHTGGLTGAEVGVAAATAFLNQKLLNALFGEAAVIEMVDRARNRLFEIVGEVLREERARFDRLVSEAESLRRLAAELRDAVGGLEAREGA